MPAVPSHRIAPSELYPGWHLSLRPSTLVALAEDRVAPLPSPSPVAAAANATYDGEVCACCERTRDLMLAYRRRQRPMGDLYMRHLNCDALVEAPNGAAADRWAAGSACKRDCEARRDRILASNCSIEEVPECPA